MKFEKYFKNYNKSIYDLLIDLDTSLIDRSVELILKCKKNNGKVFIVGNGGSSSIASHVSVDFTKVANVSSYTFNNSNLITCFANDFGHDNWIKEAVKAYMQKNDILKVANRLGHTSHRTTLANYVGMTYDYYLESVQQLKNADKFDIPDQV